MTQKEEVEGKKRVTIYVPTAMRTAIGHAFRSHGEEHLHHSQRSPGALDDPARPALLTDTGRPALVT